MFAVNNNLRLNESKEEELLERIGRTKGVDFETGHQRALSRYRSRAINKWTTMRQSVKYGKKYELFLKRTFIST